MQIPFKVVQKSDKPRWKIPVSPDILGSREVSPYCNHARLRDAFKAGNEWLERT